MKRDRAAYMREYRRLKAKAKRVVDAVEQTKQVDMASTAGRITTAFDIVKADMRIAELEEEVRHLKAEMAKRSVTYGTGGNQYSTRPFTPVPKK